MSTEEAVERDTILRAGDSRTEYLGLGVWQVDSANLGQETHMYFS